MIARVHPAGTNVVGLLKYLFGPGRREEHVDPRLIAAWENAGPRALLAPVPTGRGGWRVTTLADALMDPVRLGDRAPERPVWHCSVRLAPEDRLLSDAQWQHIAGELMAHAGIAPHGDDGAVRWVAIRHGDDHIHLVATLARQDGRSIRHFRDYLRLRDACRDLEQRYHLRPTAPADRTAHSRPGAREQHKARRLRRPRTPRDELRRRVRAIAAASASVDGFLARVVGDGLLIRLRHSVQNPAAVTGYSVALPDDRTADGSPVFYGGGRLAPDLSLPRLRRRWAGAGTGPALAARVDPALREQILRQVSLTIRDHLSHPRAPDERVAFGAAAADVLTVLAGRLHGRDRRRVFNAADALHRSVAEPPGPVRARAGRVEGMRAMGRLIAVMGQLSDQPDVFATLRLLNDLAQLSENLADLRQTQQRVHQANVARTATTWIRQVLAAHGQPPTTPATAPTRTPTASSSLPPDPRRRSRGPDAGPRP